MGRAGVAAGRRAQDEEAVRVGGRRGRNGGEGGNRHKSGWGVSQKRANGKTLCMVCIWG